MKSLLIATLIDSQNEEMIASFFHNWRKDAFGMIRLSKWVWFDGNLETLFVGGNSYGRVQWGDQIRENIIARFTERKG